MTQLLTPRDGFVALALLVASLLAATGVLALFKVPITEIACVALIGSFFSAVGAVAVRICARCSR